MTTDMAIPHSSAPPSKLQARCDVAMLLLSAGIKQKTKQKRWQRWKGVGVGKNMWSLLVWPKPESRPLLAFLSLKTAAARLSVVLSVIYKREIAAASNI